MAFGKTGTDWRSTKAAVWRSSRNLLKPIDRISTVETDELFNMDEQKALLYKNTENFLRGRPCSHALLTGPAGVGKSALIKTLIPRYHNYGLRLIQIPGKELQVLPDIIDEIYDHNHNFILYCDDIALTGDQGDYHALKDAVEGTLESPAENILVYATSSDQASQTGQKADNLNLSQLNGKKSPAEAKDYQSPVDYFGLLLSFGLMTEETYLTVVDKLFSSVNIDKEQLHEEALRFAMQRGGPGGRNARHFLNHYQIYL